jgi:hypothetical protein
MSLRTVAAGVALIVVVAGPAAAQSHGPTQLDAFMKTGAPAAKSKPKAAPKSSKVEGTQGARSATTSAPARAIAVPPASRTQAAETTKITPPVAPDVEIENALASSVSPTNLIHVASFEELNELDLLADAVQIVAGDEMNVIDLAAGNSGVGPIAPEALPSASEPQRASWLSRTGAIFTGWYAALSAFLVR